MKTRTLIVKFNRYCSTWTDDPEMNLNTIKEVIKEYRTIFRHTGGVMISDILRDLGAGKLNILNDKAWDYYARKDVNLKHLDIQIDRYGSSADYKLSIPYNLYVCVVEPPETDFVD